MERYVDFMFKSAISFLMVLFAPAINQAERTDLDCDEFQKKSMLKDRAYLTYQGA